jgi:dipeptidase E
MLQKFSPYHLILCSIFAAMKDAFLQTWIMKVWDSKVLFIPNAADPDKVDGAYPWRVRWDYEALKGVGYSVEMIDLKTISSAWLEKKMSQVGAVFVAWGNTFWLLECMQKVWFEALIRDYLSRWGCYIGSSAGSCICAPWYYLCKIFWYSIGDENNRL